MNGGRTIEISLKVVWVLVAHVTVTLQIEGKGPGGDIFLVLGTLLNRLITIIIRMTNLRRMSWPTGLVPVGHFYEQLLGGGRGLGTYSSEVSVMIGVGEYPRAEVRCGVGPPHNCTTSKPTATPKTPFNYTILPL